MLDKLIRGFLASLGDDDPEADALERVRHPFLLALVSLLLLVLVALTLSS